MLVFIVLLIALVVLLHKYVNIKNGRIIYMLKDVPQIQCLPFIGTTYRYFTKNLFVGFQEIISEIGLPNVTWVGTTANYATKDPNEIKIILNNSLDKSSNHKFLEFAFGNSLILAPVEQWKKNRKIFAKAFTQNILDRNVTIFSEKSDILLHVLKQKNDEANLFNIFENFAMDSFLETTIGVDFNIQLKKHTKYFEMIHQMQKISIRRLFNPLMYSNFMFYKFGDGNLLNEKIRYLKNFISEAMTKSEFQEKNTNRKTLMDVLPNLNENEPFSKEHLVQEILLFWFAASDTTGAALAFACVLLGMHPEIQEKIYKEVKTNPNLSSGKPLDYTDLLDLKYTEMVLMETLRIVPVVPILGRSAHEDIDLGTKIIPRGAELIISVYNLHHDENFYPDPTKFDPERFSVEESSKRPQYSFIPFSAGPRNCIGWKYALMLMKTALAKIVLNFKISSTYKTVNDFGLESDVVMRSKNNLKCNFTLKT